MTCISFVLKYEQLRCSSPFIFNLVVVIQVPNLDPSQIMFVTIHTHSPNRPKFIYILYGYCILFYSIFCIVNLPLACQAKIRRKLSMTCMYI